MNIYSNSMELLSPYGQTICASSHEGRDRVYWHISLSRRGNNLLCWRSRETVGVAGTAWASDVPVMIDSGDVDKILAI